MDHADTLHQRLGVGRGGGDRPGSHGEARLAQRLAHLLERPLPHAIATQQPHQRSPAQRAGALWRGRRHKEVEDPRTPERNTEAVELRIVAPKLGLQPIGQPDALLAQLSVHPRPLAELHDDRVLGRDSLERVSVGL